MAALPYPYASWPKLSRRQRQLLHVLRSYWDETRVQAAVSSARSLLGNELQLHVGIGEGCSAQQLAQRCGQLPATALLIEQAHAASPMLCVVELTHQAAHQLVDLALGGDASAGTPPDLAPLDELARGALAYVAARLLAATDGAWALRDIAALSAFSAHLSEDCVVCPITLTLRDRQLTFRAYVPERLALRDVPERRPARALSSLPVTLVASAGHVRLPLHAARDLTPGDVLVIDDTRLVYAHDAWSGNARAGLAGGHDQLECALTAQGLKVLHIAQAKESAMSTGHLDKAASEGDNTSIASDTPIELQVELARFSLTLGELQRMQVGDVLVTGRRIGERVSVRVSGQLFAEGELVDVEGEVGVRLLSISPST